MDEIQFWKGSSLEKKKKINWINDGPLPGEIEREGGGFAAQ
jgi:hypothetical protein